MTEQVAADLQQLRSERENAVRYLSRFDERVTHWTNWKNRIRDADAMARGDWSVVFPDSQTVNEKPKVANIVDMVLKDRPKLAASVLPTLRCDEVKEEGKAKAAKRERIAAHYLKTNKAGLMLYRFYQDLIACGANFKLVLPDFDMTAPCIRRLDPRHVWPDKAYSPDRGLGDVIVAYKATYAELEALYLKPENAGEFAALREPLKKKNELVDVIEFYDASECIKVAWHNDGSKTNSVSLARMPNLLNKLPVVASALPTFDGQFRGELDQVLSVLEHANRIETLLLDELVNWIYAQPVFYDIDNPEQWGSGVALQARSAQGFMRRMPPAASNPQVFQMREGLLGTARQGAFYPEARAGQIDQNIASAAFVSSIVGQLSTAVATDQRIEAASWEEVLALCFETDEKWFPDEKKFIAGSVNAARYAESYTPAKHIKGDYGIKVDYGFASGGIANEMQYEVRLIQQVGNGLISRRKARENLAVVQGADVLEIEKQIDMEQLKEAAMAGIMAAAQTGDLRGMAAYLDALEKGENPLLAAAQFIKGVAQPESQAPAPEEQPTAAASELGALMRGGQTPAGPAGPENVPGGFALPPLQQILAG